MEIEIRRHILKFLGRTGENCSRKIKHNKIVSLISSAEYCGRIQKPTIVVGGHTKENKIRLY